MSNSRFTFHKQEKLSSKKLISQLFNKGRWLRSKHIRLVYLTVDEMPEGEVQVMFTVPKKFHRRAVKRNLLKRRMSEVYRLKKAELYQELRSIEKKVLLAFVYSTKEEKEYGVIEGEISELLTLLQTKLK